MPERIHRSGPSKKAIEAGAALLDASGMTHPQTGPPAVVVVTDLLAAAHDPSLGEDASVRLGDVLDAIKRNVTSERGCASDEVEVWLRVGLWLEREHREGRL